MGVAKNNNFWHFFEKCQVFGQFFEKMSSFWQFFKHSNGIFPGGQVLSTSIKIGEHLTMRLFTYNNILKAIDNSSSLRQTIISVSIQLFKPMLTMKTVTLVY